MSNLVEKLKELGKYEAGRPMLKSMQRDFVQMRKRWAEHKYLKSVGHAASTSIDTLGMGVWQALNAVEVLTLISTPQFLYSVNLKAAVMVGQL